MDKLGDAISRGDIDAGVVIPFSYAKDLQRGRPVTVQLLLNAMNANTAAIAQGYAEGVAVQGQRLIATSAIRSSFLSGPTASQTSYCTWCIVRLSASRSRSRRRPAKTMTSLHLFFASTVLLVG